MDGLAQPLERGERIAVRPHEIICRHECGQRRRRMRELRRFEQIEMIRGQIVAVIALPLELVRGFRRRAQIGQFDNRLRFDAKFVMRAQDVEMIDRVAEMIRIRIKLCARIGRYLEAAEGLRAFRARLHAQFHDAFAHGRGIAEARHVANRVEHHGVSGVTARSPRRRRYRRHRRLRGSVRIDG